MDFVLISPFLAGKQKGKGRILSVQELPPYLSHVLPPSARRMCQSKGPTFAGTGYFGEMMSLCSIPGRALLQGCLDRATFGAGKGKFTGQDGFWDTCGTSPDLR